MIAAFFVITISSDLTVMLRYYYKDIQGGIWWYVIRWLRNLIIEVMYLTLTGAFYYLADFGLEARADRERNLANNNKFDTYVNVSKDISSKDQQQPLIEDNSMNVTRLQGNG